MIGSPCNAHPLTICISFLIAKPKRKVEKNMTTVDWMMNCIPTDKSGMVSNMSPPRYLIYEYFDTHRNDDSQHYVDRTFREILILRCEQLVVLLDSLH